MVERTPFDVWGGGCRRFECEGVGRGLIEPFLVTVEVILARKNRQQWDATSERVCGGQENQQWVCIEESWEI